MTQHRRSHAQRIGLIAAPLAVSALILTGCSGTSSSSSTGGSQSFSLAYATSTSVVSPFETMAKEYMAANPGVDITLNAIPNDSMGQTITTQLQAGNSSDLIETSPGSGAGQSIIPLAKAGFLDPLGDAATALIPSGNAPLFQVDGKTYGLALSISFVGSIMNTTAATAAGITSFPTDFNSVLSDCSTAASKGATMFVLAGAAGPNTGITASSIAATRVYAENPNWNEDRAANKVTFANSQGWKDTLQTIIDMNKAGCFQGGAEGAGFDAITNGMVSGSTFTMFGPSGSYADLTKASNNASTFTVETFPPATSSDKAFGLASANYSLSLNAASKNKDAANKFLDWMAQPAQSKEFADAQGSLPVTGLSSIDLSNTAYAPVASIIQSGAFVALPNSTWPNSSVYDALGTGVQGLLTGQTTVDSVLASMDTAWNQ